MADTEALEGMFRINNAMSHPYTHHRHGPDVAAHGSLDFRMSTYTKLLLPVLTLSFMQPDSESSVCDHPTCKKYFSYFTRRHHCRKCGNIFCDTHSSYQIPLDQEANYNPRGISCRACAHCYSQFKEWRSRTNSQSSSLVSSDGNVADGIMSPIIASPTTAVGVGLPRTPDVAHSVPRDWNWSTF
jgi:FYVE zinc finger